MSLRSLKIIITRSWDMILMPATVIDRIDLLVKHQQYILVFTGHKGQIIGDSDAKLKVVDEDEDENEVALKI